jgi:hypothetical protein
MLIDSPARGFLAQQPRPETDGTAAARLFVSAVLSDMVGHRYNGGAS